MNPRNKNHDFHNFPIISYDLPICSYMFTGCLWASGYSALAFGNLRPCLLGNRIFGPGPAFGQPDIRPCLLGNQLRKSMVHGLLWAPLGSFGQVSRISRAKNPENPTLATFGQIIYYISCRILKN